MKVGNQGPQVLVEEYIIFSIEDQDQNEVEHENQTKAECESQDEDENENQNTEEGNEANLKDDLNSGNNGQYEEEVNHIINIYCFVLYHIITLDHGT